MTVYRVPLEKQKLREVPPHLAKVVKKLLGNDTSVLSASQMQEWSNSVHSFLKEKNWGENIGQIGESLSNVQKQIGQNISNAQKQIGKNISNAQKHLAQSLQQQNPGGSGQEASLMSRLKSFGVDFVIFLIVIIALKMTWWLGEGIIFGKVSLSSGSYRQLTDKAVKEQYQLQTVGGESVYVRTRGLFEFLIHLNIQFPLLLAVLYLAFPWKILGSSPGQIVAKTKLIMQDGSPVTWEVAFKRAGLFVASTILFGLGAVPIFFGEKQTFFDSYCKTRVIE